jgi:hypothetical protein
LTQQETLIELTRIRTPTLYNANEKFDVRPRTDGIMDPSIRSLLPSLGPMIGYACTGKEVGADPPIEGEPVVAWRGVWELAQKSASPTVMVTQDLDNPSASSCAWGTWPPGGCYSWRWWAPSPMGAQAI